MGRHARRGCLGRLWHALTSPPRMRPAYLAVYLVTVATGLATLMEPPRTIEGELGPVLTGIWAAAFIGGGLIGTCTVLTPWWWLERIGIAVSLIGGLGTYVYVTAALHLAAPPGEAQTTELGVAVLAAAAFVVRWISIRAYSYDPRAPRPGR